jgi:hypothetical protein
MHPKAAMIAFNLACYASVTGRMEDAQDRLGNAIELDKNVQILALDDEDLRPLWDWITGCSSHQDFGSGTTRSPHEPFREHFSTLAARRL